MCMNEKIKNRTCMMLKELLSAISCGNKELDALHTLTDSLIYLVPSVSLVLKQQKRKLLTALD